MRFNIEMRGQRDMRVFAGVSMSQQHASQAFEQRLPMLPF
jgi:hypothetical protein